MAKKKSQNSPKSQIDKTKAYERPKNPYDILDERYRIAIDMRLLLYKYEIIAFRMMRDYKEKVTVGTLRQWFSVGGECHEGYKYQKAVQTNDISEDLKGIREQLELLAPDAINALRHRLQKNSEAAAIKILGILGFSEVMKIKDESPSILDQYEQLFKRAEAVDHKTSRTRPLKKVQNKRKASKRGHEPRTS